MKENILLMWNLGIFEGNNLFELITIWEKKINL